MTPAAKLTLELSVTLNCVGVEADPACGAGQALRSAWAGLPPHGASVRRGDPGLKAGLYEYRSREHAQGDICGGDDASPGDGD